MSLSQGSRLRRSKPVLMRSVTTFTGSPGEQAEGRLIPRPDMPVQPVLSWPGFGRARRSAAPSLVDAGQVFFVTAARIAILHALELAGIKPGQKVLLPAYHCMSLVEPVIHIGAEP